MSRPGSNRTIGSYGRASEMKGLSNAAKAARIDLGLAIARRHARPGVPMSLCQLAEFCGCTDARIQQIEKAALRKVRLRLREIGVEDLAVFSRRSETIEIKEGDV